MKRKQIILTIAAVFVAAVIFFGVYTYLELRRSARQLLESIEIEPVDISLLADGTYHGSYNGTPVAAQVEVIVSQGAVTEITIISHQHGRGQNGEAVIESVIDQQSLDVDTISGATISSKVILKAIEVSLH